MSEFDDAAEDLRAAFAELQEAKDEQPRQRRALKTVLNELYRVQEYRLGRNKVNQPAYFAHAEADDSGRVTLGIVYLRSVLTHHLVKPASPAMRSLFPSENLFPGNDVFPGENFEWITAAELDQVHTPDPRFAKGKPFYDTYVGGRLTLQTIRQAIDFLLADPTVVRFEYV